MGPAVTWGECRAAYLASALNTDYARVLAAMRDSNKISEADVKIWAARVKRHREGLAA